MSGTSGTSLESRSFLSKKQDFKASLVVQECQEDKGYIRTDAPTGSRDAFLMKLSAAAQDGWDYNVFDAQSAYLQSGGIERLLLLRMPHKNPPPGTMPGQMFVATGSIYGTRGAGRVWCEHSKKVLEAAGLVESRPKQSLYFQHGPTGLEAVAHTQVDDLCIVIPCGAVNLEACSAVCFGKADGEKISMWFGFWSHSSSSACDNWILSPEHDHQLAELHHQESCQIHTGSGGTRCV